MSQHDMSIEDGPGLTVRENMNGAVQALVTLSSGPVEPQTKWPGMLWLDTSVSPDGILRMRNLLNSAWIAPPSATKGGADMSSGTRLTPDRYYWNDKLDGSGLDLMTLTDAGVLRVNGTAAPVIEINKPAAGGNSNVIRGLSVNSKRWEMNLGEGTAESGSNNGSNFSLVSFADNGTTVLRTNLSIARTSGDTVFGGKIKSTSGYMSQAGVGGANSGNVFNLEYTGGVTRLWIDTTNVGTITVSSDYRIKKDVEDLPGTWDLLKGLRPIKYTLADAFDGLFVANDIEQWGFLAHELQEALIPSAASGEKDGDAVQSPNPWTLLAAAIKTIQECQTRIEALEAA